MRRDNTRLALEFHRRRGSFVPNVPAVPLSQPSALSHGTALGYPFICQRDAAMRRALAVLFVITAVAPIRAEENPKSSADVRRERIERVNKVWDAQIERIRGA